MREKAGQGGVSRVYVESWLRELSDGDEKFVGELESIAKDSRRYTGLVERAFERAFGVG